MELNDRVEQLEHEMTILKNEIQAVLLDLRESYLARENPFEPGSPAMTAQSASLDQVPEEMATKDGTEGESAGGTPIEETGDWTKLEVTTEKIAPGGVKGARWPDVKSESSPLKAREIASENTSLAMVTALTHWAAESTKQLGQEGAKAVVEISELMGNMPPDIKSIMFKLISLRPSEHPGEVTKHAYLSSLVKLTDSLGKCNKTEAALISILLEQKENG